MNNPARGVPLVLSAPSGGGKTTLCHRLVDELSKVEFSISHTTRSPRGKEVDGVDYHFVDDSEFKSMVDAGKFLEWAEVHSKNYGTALEQAELRLSQGIDILFDIDIQGGHQIADRMDDAVLIFILPPSMTILGERLRGRGTDSSEQIEKRMQAAAQEIKEATGYTHWIVNDDLDSAYEELKSIVLAERIRRRSRDRIIEDFFKV